MFRSTFSIILKPPALCMGFVASSISLVLLLALGCVSNCATPPPAAQATIDAPTDPPDDPLAGDRDAFLSAIHSAPTSAFIPIRRLEGLPAEIYFPTAQWQRLILASPRSSPNTAFALATPQRPRLYDLLRHQYRIAGLPITTFECASAFFVRTPRSYIAPLGEIWPQRLRAFAMKALSLRRPPDFSPISPHIYSTAPTRHLESLGDWSERIDVVLEEETVGLMIHKIRSGARNHHELFIDHAHWFPESFPHAQDRSDHPDDAPAPKPRAF